MLTVKVLGHFDIRISGRPVEIATHSAQSLLAYLLLNAGSVHRRAKLAGLFWPDASESNARSNLRHALWRIRKAIGREYLLTDNVSIAFEKNADYWVDAAVLHSAVDETASVDELIEVVAVYDGELLPGFYDDWVVLERERLRAVFDQQCSRLLHKLVEQREWQDILQWGERWVAQGQASELAYRLLMLAHAELGNQASVAAVYRRCVDALQSDLDVTPSQETQMLFKQLSRGERLFHSNIEAGGQDVPRSARSEASSRRRTSLSLPAFLNNEIEPPALEQSLFVERERELTRLEGFLEEALAGRGKVVFVTGSAGRGKTSLIREFVRRAQTTHADLLVASGDCNAYAGRGDPFLPFRDVMNMLTGALEAKWLAGAITRAHAQRLWWVLPETVQAILDAGPDLIDTFVSGAALARRVESAGFDDSIWFARLSELTARRERGSVDLEQTYLFEQYVSVLERLASRCPLLITLDDLQWADTASISLLFHLGRRIGGSSILIVGAYRPEETSLGWDGSRHPLQKVLGEFTRAFGDNQVDLSSADEGDGRRFVDVFLDTQPNLLNEEFRRSLFRQTGGHPLFTVELLRAMQARGDLVQDQTMRWIVGPALDWSILPARIEAVIAERIGRLDARLHGILTVASVEGESFTAEVVARVQGLDQLQTLRHLSQELGKRHRLVREEEEIGVDSQFLSRYRFSHILFQRYLYDNMDSGERRRLHLEIAQALEDLYGGRKDVIAAQLLHHHLGARMRTKAIESARLAAGRAEAVYAYAEAVQHLQTALDLLEGEEEVEIRLALLEHLADLQLLLANRTTAISVYQAALSQWSDAPDADQVAGVRLHRKILQTGIAMKETDYEELEVLSPSLDVSRAVLDASLSQPESDFPQRERIHIMTALAVDAGIGLRLPLNLDRAESHARLAVELAGQLDAPVALSEALQALIYVHYARGMLPKQLDVSNRLLELSRHPRFGDLRRRISVLSDVSSSLILVGDYSQALRLLQEAEGLADQIGAVDRQVGILNYQVRCLFLLDRWDAVLEVLDRCRELAARYTPDQMGMTCVILSFSAAVLALRGESRRARNLREEAYEIMVRGSGGSPDNWGRNQHY